MKAGPKSAGDQLLHFGPFEVNLTSRAVFRNGIRLKLQQQPFSVLELLIERAPDIVLREDIRRRVWGDNVHVDAEQGIAFCIRQIRSVLGDNSTSPHYIETVPRQGFRFIGKLDSFPEKRAPDDAVNSAESVLASGVTAADIPNNAFRTRIKITRWFVPASVGIALLLVMGAIASRVVQRHDVYTVSRIDPIVTFPGAAIHPCYSPDGQLVTFSWDSQGGRSIYVAQPRSEHPVRITHGEWDDFPRWSPDGKYIAFLRLRDPYQGELMIIRAFGGEERTLHSVDLSWSTRAVSNYLAWTPDSKWICFTTRPEKSTIRVGLMLLSPDTGELRSIFLASGQNASDSSPAFSPDGRWLAFVRYPFPQNAFLLLQRLSGEFQPEGDPIAVRGSGAGSLSPVWTPDSRSLLFLNDSRLFQVEINDVKAMRPARQIYVADGDYDSLSFGGPTPRLCTSSFSGQVDFWAVSLKGSSADPRVPRKILASNATEYFPEYSPNGQMLTFVSDRDGSDQVWVASADGGHPRQLSHLGPHTILGFPRWSPDGKSIAFHARVPDDAELYVIRVEDGALHQVTYGGPSTSVPSWSADGAFLYGFGLHEGAYYIFRIPLISGKREILWEGILPREVPGRQMLLYAKVHQHSIFARRLTEHGPAEPEQKLVDDFTDVGFGEIHPSTDGFYYVSRDLAGIARAFCFYSFDTQKTVDVAPVPPHYRGGFAVSQDRNTLLYAAAKSDEIKLISMELKKDRR